jgi:hypothetical protein
VADCPNINAWWVHVKGFRPWTLKEIHSQLPSLCAFLPLSDYRRRAKRWWWTDRLFNTEHILWTIKSVSLWYKPFRPQWSLYVPYSGHCMYRTVVTIYTTSLTFNNSTFCPHSVFMYFVWISEKTGVISLHNFNWLVFITETVSVYCAVRTGSLCINQNLFAFKSLVCTIHTVHCTHCARCTLCTIHTVHCTHSALYTLCTVHTVHCTHCALYTLCTIYTALYTLCTIHTVHYTHCTIHTVQANSKGECKNKLQR